MNGRKGKEHVMQDTITVTARRHRDHLHVTCPFCARMHQHTAAVQPGAADGERRAHCRQGSYVIRETAP